MLAVFSLEDGGRLWRYSLPEDKQGTPKPGAVFNRYSSNYPPLAAPNGRVYYYAEGLLHEWDKNGVLLNTYPSTYYRDRWVSSASDPQMPWPDS